MTKKELIEHIKSDDVPPEGDTVVQALLAYIDDPEIEQAWFDAVKEWWEA